MVRIYTDSVYYRIAIIFIFKILVVAIYHAKSAKGAQYVVNFIVLSLFVDLVHILWESSF